MEVDGDVANFELNSSVIVESTRFDPVEDDERDRILDGLHSDNTKKATKRSVKLFRSWLSATGRDSNFELLSASAISDLLSHFWLEVRTKKKERYKGASMMNIRNGLNRHLQEVRENQLADDDNTRFIDIMNDVAFKGSNRIFTAMIKELKRTGKGDIKHHDRITDVDLRKCYEYFQANTQTSARALQLKVYFDIVLHLIRRGRENIRILTVAHFKIETDSTGQR